MGCVLVCCEILKEEMRNNELRFTDKTGEMLNDATDFSMQEFIEGR